MSEVELFPGHVSPLGLGTIPHEDLARYSGLELSYGRFSGDTPREVHLTGQGIDLTLGLNQIEPSRELTREQLVSLSIPADVAPVSLQELRDAGPLGER